LTSRSRVARHGVRGPRSDDDAAVVPSGRVSEVEDLSGRTLGDFVLRARIGEGGFGAVYRCDRSPHRPTCRSG